MPTRSAICASSGEYTPPVNTYSSSLSSSRNLRPVLSMAASSARARGRRHGGGAPATVEVRVDLGRATPAARGAAIVTDVGAGAHLTALATAGRHRSPPRGTIDTAYLHCAGRATIRQFD